MLKLDQQTGTATLLDQYTLSGGVDSEYMGDTSHCPTATPFVGWGSEPYFSEYTGAGKLLLEAELPGPDLTYRATLEPWHGEPLTAPAAAARRRAGRDHGVRELERSHAGRLMEGPAGSAQGSLAVVAAAVRAGFETAIPVPAPSRRFEVQALDADGRVIGTSRPFSAAS